MRMQRPDSFRHGIETMQPAHTTPSIYPQPAFAGGSRTEAGNHRSLTVDARRQA
jgi:hypothetical protein